MTEVKQLSSVCAFSGHEVHENNYGDIEVDYHIYALIYHYCIKRPCFQRPNQKIGTGKKDT